MSEITWGQPVEGIDSVEFARLADVTLANLPSVSLSNAQSGPATNGHAASQNTGLGK